MPYIEINGLTTYYESAGDGRPIVFVHGALSDHQLWRHQLEAFQEDYHVIAYDVRDHGKTAGPAEEYTIARLAADLHAIITSLDIEKPVICGLSMGGFIAQQHAIEYPADAAGYVFADTYTPETFSTGEYALRYVFARAVEEMIDIVGYERPRQVLEAIDDRLADEEGQPDETTIEELRDDPITISDDEARRIWHATNSWHRTTLDLSRITHPVLCIYGEHELDYINAHVGRMATEISDFRAHEIPDAGHNAHVANPEAFNDHLRTFVRDVHHHDA